MLELKEIQRKISDPPVLVEKDLYSIKFATTPEEIEGALKLRYEVFNVEQGKGLDASDTIGIDRDEFDDYCLHLIVEHREVKKPVGTYRIHLGQVASSALGFYSAREFHIKGIDEIANQTIEVGRSCVSPEYRNGTVVALLWSGISEILFRSRQRYLFGCVSLENTDPAAGWALYEYLKANGKCSESIFASPTDTFKLQRPQQHEIDAILSDRRKTREILPPLFKGYLRLGAKICGEPAFDYEFGTIDFLILLDAGNLPERYTRHFNVVEL